MKKIIERERSDVMKIKSMLKEEEEEEEVEEEEEEEEEGDTVIEVDELKREKGEGDDAQPAAKRQRKSSVCYKHTTWILWKPWNP